MLSLQAFEHSTTTTHSSMNSKSSARSHLSLSTQVEVVNSLNETIQVRALLDQGSEVSLVSEKLVQCLRIPRSYTRLSLLGIGDQPPVKSRGLAYLNIRPHFDSQIQVDISAYILPKVTSKIPAANTPCTGWPHLNNLLLADPHFNEPGQIDILLGADVCGQLLLEDPVKKGPANSPVAQSTTLGWILSGPCDTSHTINQAHSFHCVIDHDLNKALERFWQQEEMSTKSNKSLTPADQQCEHHCVSTHSREQSGRYIVRLPFSASTEQLENSKPVAIQMLKYLQRKFDNDQIFYQAYSSFLNEYKSLQHMSS
ncbi:uncharacterized protein LOC117172879 [Belonocnema kinseyi]|uniref:uncharacterized protein LOC117172879 n=1 Tax=Belonocnema kinseyi TaxID=2817044 RepID=UPI00143D0FF2|nr:uncharacterized protein LOC117172879 [Belonocnema kinseyi]